MVRIVDLPTTGTVDSNTYVPVFQNGKTKKIAATSLGGGGGSVNDQIHTSASKTTPADADELGVVDSAATWGLKRLTFANLKAWIGSLFVSKSGDTINGDLSVAGNVLVTSGALGYGVGAGGTAVQATSKSTAVALNKPSGKIVMFNNPTNFPSQSAINAGGVATFFLVNNYITPNDGCDVVVAGGMTNANSYRISVYTGNTGAALISLTNQSGTSLSEPLVLSFRVNKGAAS